MITSEAFSQTTILFRKRPIDTILNSASTIIITLIAIFIISTIISFIISFFKHCLPIQLPWDNYRLSHSDGKPYGDLDPRFLDDINRNENPYKDLDVTLGTLRTYTAITERKDL